MKRQDKSIYSIDMLNDIARKFNKLSEEITNVNNPNIHHYKMVFKAYEQYFADFGLYNEYWESSIIKNGKSGLIDQITTVIQNLMDEIYTRQKA